MKIKDIITENEYGPEHLVKGAYDYDQQEVEKVANYITKNCQPWLNQINNQKDARVFRGVDIQGMYDSPAFIRKVRHERRPKDTDQKRHQAFNHLIQAAGGIANRTNSVFVSSSQNQAAAFGSSIYSVYPIGNFEFTWSPHYQDWTEEFEHYHMLRYLSNEKIISALKQSLELESITNAEFKFAIEDLKHDVFDGNMKVLLDRVFYGNSLYDNIAEGNISEHRVQQDILTHDLVRAINSHHEIMIHCDNVLLISASSPARFLTDVEKLL